MIAAVGLALSKFGSWVANNKVVQWIIGAAIFIIGLVLWGDRREGQGEDKQKLKNDKEALKQKERAIEYIETVEEEAADAAEQAIERRDTASPLDPERMPDDQRARIFGRNRAPKEGG